MTCKVVILVLLALAWVSSPALAQMPDLGNLFARSDGQTSGTIIQLFGVVTILALAPGILVVVTSFTRFVIAFSILRMGLGLQTTPANLILISLALFMTLHVMQPTFDRAWESGLEPLQRGAITEQQALVEIAKPFREFMLEHVRKRDLDLFADLSAKNGQLAEYDPETISMRALVPAFMISEIKRGFEIGFLILLPFLAIDLIVATIVMAMGMMMLPPTVVSLPFKILFFVLVDGWSLLAGSMVRSFL